MSQPTPSRKIDFFYFDAGGGHRSAANALREVIEREGRPWEIRLVNLQEMLEPLDLFRKITGLRLEDVYNLMLKKGWTLGSPQLTRGMHLLIRLYHRGQVRLIEEHWRRDRPDLVVSLIPNFNRAIFDSLRNVSPETPMVTVLTDLADFTPHFWLEPQDQYVICGSAKAVEQASSMGLRPEKIFRTSGMILHPRFYEPATMDRAAERHRLGLQPDLPTALVLFGGQGSGAIAKIAKKLDASGLAMQLILVCGHNQKLAARLRAMNWRIPVRIEGFTAEVPHLMQPGGFPDRQTGSRQHQRSSGDEAACDCGKQRLDTSSGTLQPGMDPGERRGRGGAELLPHRSSSTRVPLARAVRAVSRERGPYGEPGRLRDPGDFRRDSRRGTPAPCTMTAPIARQFGRRMR